MQTNQRYFLKKEDRLKSRKAIDLLFKTGKSFSVFPFRIYWQLLSNEQGLKAGFTTSSKNFKHATDRNKIKRLIREAYRLQKNDLKENILLKNKGINLFFIYTGKEVPTYELVSEKIAFALKKIIKLINGTDE
jgi:ribonuclease P protein component